MNIGDLVTIRNHPEYIGIITKLSELESGLDGWIAVKWFNNDDGFSEFQIPLSSADHIEVIK